MVDYGQMRYNLLGSGGHWFPGARAEKVDRLDLSACLKQSRHADRIPEALKDAHRRLGGKAVQRLSQS